MKYFFLKLGAGNEEAEVRLTGSKTTAAVFFDDFGPRDYKQGKGKTQPRLFWSCGHAQNRKNTVMVVINRGRIWLLQPEGEVVFSNPYSHGSGGRLTTKEMPVTVLFSGFCKDVPPVLAGMGSSQHHGRRTFTQASNWGNLKAIDCVLGRATDTFLPPEEHWSLDDQGPAQLLECLGSTELETLVGKLFEANGCHVPAYLGGTLRDIDIFAYNDGENEISVGEITLPPGQRISLQVKTWSGLRCPDSVDCLIGLDAVSDRRTFDAAWLLSRVRESPLVLHWLRRSLNWLPSVFLRHFEM